MTITLQDILDILNGGGVLATFVIFVVGCLKRWWVFGWAYDQLKEDRDEWKALALSGTYIADKAVTLAAGKKKVQR